MADLARSLKWVTSIREEDIGGVPYVANTGQVLPSQGGILPSDKFYYGLRIKVRGRITDAAGGAPAVQYADWPWSIINRIHIEGYHRPRAAQEPFFDMRGPDIREFFSVTQGAFSTLLVATAAVPILTPVPPRALLNGFAAGANLTTDFIIIYDIIFPPAWPQPSPGITRQQAQWLLDAPNYDRLVMTIFWGDVASGYSGANLPALGGFMVGAGAVPDCTVQALYALGGKNDLFQGFVPGRVWRYFGENTTGDILATVVGSRQYNVPRGFKIARLMTKTGVKSILVTAGNDAYVTLLNTVFPTNIRLNYGTNKTVRLHPDYHSLRETNRQSFELLPSDGYGILDFISHGILGEALDCQNLVAGPTGDVDVFLSTNTLAGANQGALFLVEELRGTPQFV
jgi:hypothetical protein